MPLKGIESRVKGGIIRPFFSTFYSDVRSSNSSSVWCLHLQIGGNNQQSSHSGALILQRLSIAALPSAARSCLGLGRLIGSDVLSFLLKLICGRRAPLSKFFLLPITRSPAQRVFWECKMKGLSDYNFACLPVRQTWMDMLQIAHSRSCQMNLILVSGAERRACFEG